MLAFDHITSIYLTGSDAIILSSIILNPVK